MLEPSMSLLIVTSEGQSADESLTSKPPFPLQKKYDKTIINYRQKIRLFFSSGMVCVKFDEVKPFFANLRA